VRPIPDFISKGFHYKYQNYFIIVVINSNCSNESFCIVMHAEWLIHHFLRKGCALNKTRLNTIPRLLCSCITFTSISVCKLPTQNVKKGNFGIFPLRTSATTLRTQKLIALPSAVVNLPISFHSPLPVPSCKLGTWWSQTTMGCYKECSHFLDTLDPL
jgi:hypothetical protein